MTIAIIPDMHGRNNWEKVKSLEFDVCISLGDWFDSFDIPCEKQIENFKNYMSWVKEDPLHRLSCIGNHDFHYIWPNLSNSIASGYQDEHAEEIREVLLENIMYFNIFIRVDDIYFSHAGFTKKWIKQYNVNMKTLNSSWASDATVASKLCFQTNDSLSFDEHGDDVFQGPIWTRPRSLMINSNYNYQVVGHTELEYDDWLWLKRNNVHVIFTDSPEHDKVHLLKVDDIKNDELYSKLTFDVKRKL